MMPVSTSCYLTKAVYKRVSNLPSLLKIMPGNLAAGSLTEKVRELMIVRWIGDGAAEAATVWVERKCLVGVY